ncbi:acyl-CoA dehydrogenase family protein [Microtetraspora glauca]|uniref:Medium-chain specific acyl-CoA dehydrogenase, mitochondrial n=1 Tax=Microtetraspora glauca TaxID=1996 RepID=A0ABV3GL47_MICGL
MAITATAAPPRLGGPDPAILALPFFEPRHAEVAARVTGWCLDHGELLRHAEDAPDEGGRRILRGLGEAGLLAFLDPGSDPGSGSDAGHAGDGDLRSLCVAREVLAYAGDLADFALAIQTLAATPILRYGTAAQRRRYLPGLAAGTLQAAFAVSEPQAGSDVAAITTTAERDGDGYTLHGVKAWIAGGGTADVYCVIARTGEGGGSLGLSALLVPAGAPGFTVEPVAVTAPRAFAHLRFDGVRLPADALLGRAGGGFPLAMEVLDRFRMTVGAAALGFARRAADAALAHARRRRIYGGPLLDLATTRAALADIEVKLNAAALLVARAAWEADQGNRRYPRHSSIAKLYATEVAQEIVDACVQMHGAAGLVAGSLPERLYRQIRSLRIYEGTSEVQRSVIAGSLDVRRAEKSHDLFADDASHVRDR